MSVPTVELIFAVLLLPVFLAMFSRRILILSGAILLAGIALLSVLEPAYLSTIVAVSAYIGCVVLSILGIQARRRDATIKAELMALRKIVNEVQQAESRRIVAELRSGGPASRYI